MARVPHLARPGAWQKPLARIEGERILKARAMEQRVLEQKAKVEAEAKRVEEMESQKLDEKVDDLREQLDRLTNDLPKIIPSGGGGKRMVAKVLARDYPDVAVFDPDNFATAAQGALADSAIQPAAIGVSVQAYSANLDEYATVNPTAAGLALLDDTDAAAQRTTLGLGTAAVKNTGTSGDAVPLLDGVNIWSGAQTITSASAGATLLKLESTEAGAVGGPQLDLDRNSASPAANDVAGIIRFLGRDSGGNATTYGNINATVLDPTDGSEDGRLILQVPVAGAQTSAVSIANGMIVGAPTGSYQGTGTVNATDYYRNGTALSSTLFGVAVGDASGNLKALNADGGFTFATTTTSVNVGGAFGGAWVVAHRSYSSDTATYSGSRATTAIMREATGSGTNGPSRADYALHVESVKTNYLTSAVQGEIDGMNIVVRQGELGDAAALLFNAHKVESASYGQTGLEGVLRWAQATTGTTLREFKVTMGANIPGTDLRAGGAGFTFRATDGATGGAFNALSDAGATIARVLTASSSLLAANTYFEITGNGHADGSGLLRAGAGLVTKPALTFVGDDDTGLYSAAANVLGIATGGTVRMLVGPGVRIGAGLTDPGAGILNVLTSISINNTKVIGARDTGWSAMTGTAAKGAFDTETMTTLQMARKLKAISDALIAHGLIGA